MGRVLGGALFVAGTTLGAAMLALPVSTGLAGFFPASVMLLLFWLFMTFSAFCFLEVNLWLPDEADIITMAKKTLGKWGERISWTAYLFLLYALTTAYVAMSAPIVEDFLEMFTGWEIPSSLAPLPILFAFAWILYLGVKWADWLNRWLMGGLVLAYVALVFCVAPEVSRSHLLYQDWQASGLGISVVATAFGYHIIIPSLTSYLKRDVGALKKVLLVGGVVPLLMNLLWVLLVLGSIPIEGTWGIQQGYEKGISSAVLLKEVLQLPLIAHGARLFAFFAIATSFLGVSLSLFHFLMDGLAIERNRKGKLLLSLLTFIPPLLLTWSFPRVAFTALEYAGVVGVVFLLGGMPCLMVYVGRYHKQLSSPQSFSAPGGRAALVLGMLFSLTVIMGEILMMLPIGI